VRYQGAVAAALALAGALLPAVVDAQITIDGSLRPNTAGPLAGPNFVIGSEVGRQVGNNLFHSFGQFNVGAGESATFTGLASTSNVIGRVTGGQLSSINGLIDTRTFMPSANFFLLNPAGIMLGSGAALNIGGAFHFTTADYLCLGSQGCLADPAAGKFFVNPNAPSVLTVAAPASFGFINPPTAPIAVEGSVLAADPGQTMSFVGGPVQVTGGAVLSAPGGHVRLVSASSAGEVPLPSFDVQGVPALGSINVTGAFIDVSGDAAGSVAIRGGQLVIDSSVILAATGGADGGPIELSGRDGVTLQNTSALVSLTSGPGRGGDIRLDGGNVEITGGSALLSTRAGDGPGGDIVVTGDTVRLAGASALLSSNGAEGAARNGSVSVTSTGAMVITEASSLQSTADVGDGAPVTVTAGSLTMDQGALIKSTATTGRGGDVVVTASELSVQSGAQVASTVAGPGHGGDLHVSSSGTATISGEFTGINTASFCDFCTPPDQAVAGDIVASFGSLTLTDRATIQSGVIFGFQAGNVSVVATGPIVISNLAGIASQAFTGDAGSVTISAPQTSISHGFISTATLGSGRAGDIMMSGGSLELANGGQIVSASIVPATGAGGDVHINLGTSLTISGSSPTGGSSLPPAFAASFTDPRSGIFSTAAAEGPGGNITIQAPKIRLQDGGTISAASTGTENATAGNINITFGDLLEMTNATISTDSLLADGGNITILSTGSTLHMVDSQITTSVQSGLGSGGNITLGLAAHAIDFIVLHNSGIHADAFGGPGGNINIFASVLLSSTSIQTAITASSALNSPGVINVSAVATDVSGSIPDLSTEAHEAAALLRASCAARLADGKASSLVVAGREGVPLEPGGLVPSGLVEPRRMAGAGDVASFLASEWPRIRLAYRDAACGR
jgi:filamentous hemagglutinin family protein